MLCPEIAMYPGKTGTVPRPGGINPGRDCAGPPAAGLHKHERSPADVFLLEKADKP